MRPFLVAVQHLKFFHFLLFGWIAISAPGFYAAQRESCESVPRAAMGTMSLA
jgi:hypothetical protein